MNPSGDPELHFRIESELPAAIEVGRGNLLTVYGWCFHARHEIRRLELLAGGERQPLVAHGMPRPDVAHQLGRSTDAAAHAFRSGFWGFLSIRELDEPAELEIGLRARLAGGGDATRPAGRIRLEPGPRRRWARLDGGLPKVAVCMATFNPPPDLFRRQIESIRAQTHGNWVCLISDDDSRPEAYAMIEELVGDDPRFSIQRNRPRLGYYRNFERVLASVPQDAELVALSDQDDNWHSDKLASLVERISGDVTLAYSDMRVTDGEGGTISPTFWTERANNPNDLAALLIVNSVTGGSAVFRSELLEYALPFPNPPEDGLHDHWMALVANSLGRLDYVDRPLYDYVQHGGAALGHESLRRPVIKRGPGFWRAIRSPAAFKAAVARRLSRMRTNYKVVIGARAAATLLLLRGGRAIPRRNRRVLRRWSRVERSPLLWPWLWVKARINEPRTLGSERRLVAGSLWRVTLGAVKMLRLPPPPPGRETLASIMKLPLSSEPVVASRLQRQIAPLALDVSAGAPRRVNVLIPTIDLDLFHGGYITEFNLARRLAESGLRVRVVSVDEPFYLPPTWPRDLDRIEGLEGITDAVEVEPLHDRSKSLAVGPEDRFVATSWWTAQIAHRATGELGGERFLYVISECEPLTMPLGSEAALARESYGFPHFALFSSELLRDYFRERGLGVFAGDGGDDASAAFEEAIAPIRAPSEEELRNSERRLLFQTRPELHAQRNLFELGLLALADSRAEGTLEGWLLDGIGARQPSDVRYGGDLRVKVLQRKQGEGYGDQLRGHAVGLSLMLSPRPDPMTLEMAAAGMPVVTNTFENKTAEALAALSENLIAVEPTIEGLKAGIRDAVAASADHERRLRGAEVRWARGWEQAFGPELLERLRGMLERA